MEQTAELAIPSELPRSWEPLDTSSARALVNQIRQGLATIIPAMIELWQRRGWMPLGYDSWDDLCTAEFRGLLQIPKTQRVATVVQLSNVGMSTRAIGSALGVGKSTVDRDLATVPNGTIERTVTGLDNKVRRFTIEPAREPGTVQYRLRDSRPTRELTRILLDRLAGRFRPRRSCDSEAIVRRCCAD